MLLIIAIGIHSWFALLLNMLFHMLLIYELAKYLIIRENIYILWNK